jgi:hypothetical protein
MPDMRQTKWPIQIAGRHMTDLRWIPGYQVLPRAAVTHVAKIDRFEQIGDDETASH